MTKYPASNKEFSRFSSLQHATSGIYMTSGASVTFGRGIYRYTPEDIEGLYENIGRITQMIDENRQELEALKAAISNLEIPETFDLPAMPSKQVSVKIEKIEPAPFYFVDDYE